MGIEFPPEFQPKVNGCNDYNEARIIIDHFKLNMTPEYFIKIRIEHLNELLPSSPLVLGIEKIIGYIHSIGIPIAVATSSHRNAYEVKISKHKDLFKLFGNNVVCGNEIERGKPFPDVFLKVLNSINKSLKSKNSDCELLPANVLVFEDAAFGVKAASWWWISFGCFEKQ